MITLPHKMSNIFFDFDLHKGIFLIPPLPTPGWAVHFGMGFLSSAYKSGTNKNNFDKILVDNQVIVSRNHCPEKRILPHWNLFLFFPWQPNIYIPFLILGSKSKCQFAAMSVEGPDGPIAVSLFKTLGINIACNDPVSLPTSFVINTGTVEIGFTMGDLLSGLLNYLFDLLIEAIFDFIWDKTLGKLTSMVGNYFQQRGLFKGQMKWLLRQIDGLFPGANVMIFKYKWSKNLPKNWLDALRTSRGTDTLFRSMSEELLGKIGEEIDDGLKDFFFENIIGDPQAKIDEAVERWIDSASESIVSNLQENETANRFLSAIEQKIDGVASNLDEAVEAHFNRNNNDFQNKVPVTQADLLAANDDGYWTCRGEESTHNYGTSGNVKYVGRNGEEVIYDSEGNIVLSPENMGTFNLADPGEHPIRHFMDDVIPWLLLGNSRNDQTTPEERLELFFVDGTVQKTQQILSEMGFEDERLFKQAVIRNLPEVGE